MCIAICGYTCKYVALCGYMWLLVAICHYISPLKTTMQWNGWECHLSFQAFPMYILLGLIKRINAFF